MTIDQWKGYLFTEQLSAAAEQYELEVSCVKAPNVSFDFAQGARWCLQSELVRELEAALVYETKTDAVDCDCMGCLALQKLKEARGEK